MIQFLFDEHLPTLYETALRKEVSGIVTRRVSGLDAPHQRAPDPELLCWCELNRFVLVSNDRKTMPRHFGKHLLAGRHVPGVLMLRQNAFLSAIIEELAVYAKFAPDDEFYDRLCFLPILPEFK